MKAQLETTIVVHIILPISLMFAVSVRGDVNMVTSKDKFVKNIYCG